MPDKKKNKTVNFAESKNEIQYDSNDSGKIKYRTPVPKSHRDKLPRCDINKLKNFPCVYRGITFDTKEDILEFIDLKTANIGLKRENVVDILKYTNNYRREIPIENRLYNLDNGEIYNIWSYNNPSIINTDPNTIPRPKSRLETLRTKFKNTFTRGGTRRRGRKVKKNYK
jgi:hypothetical protein